MPPFRYQIRKQNCYRCQTHRPQKKRRQEKIDAAHSNKSEIHCKPLKIVIVSSNMKTKKYHSLKDLMADKSLWGGKRISYRALSDLTEERTGVRVAYGTLYAIASGKAEPKLETLQRIAQTAGVHFCAFFTANPADCEDAPDEPDEGTPI